MHLLFLEGFTQIKVLTYNIRYNNAGDGSNAWALRKEAIADSIKLANPDIICFQEVLYDQYVFLNDNLFDYFSYGIGRDDGKTVGEYSPVFVRKSKFEVIDSGTFWLSENPENPSKGWDAALNRISSWVKIKEISTNKALMVFNTHFDHIGKIAQKNSAALIIQKSVSIAGKLPCIITGDFNLTPQEAPYALILKSGFDDAFLKNKQLETYTFTGFVLDLKIAKRIDYIFSNKKLKASTYQTYKWKTATSAFLSDHLPVEAILIWK